MDFRAYGAGGRGLRGPEPPVKRPLSALYYRDFRFFWAGQFISFSGTWMHSTAQGWLVYALTGSPFYLGLVAAASSFPILLFSLLGGVVADRFRKRNLLLLTQALSIIPPLAIGVLTSMDEVKVWHVVVSVLALGTINAFDMPARHSFLVEMVEEGHLLNAVALNSAAFNGSRIFGPVIAGLTIAHVGLPACFYLNALSFVPVVLALSLMKAKGEGKTGGGILKEIAEGVRFIAGEPKVLRPVLLVATFSLFGMPFVALLPVYAEKILGVGAKGLGFLSGSAGAGAFVAAVLLAFKGDLERDKQRLMGAASLVFAIALFVFSRSNNYYFSLSALFVVGFSVVSLLTLANSFLQISTPDALRGRVMSFYTFVLLGMAPLGNSIMGAVAERITTVNAVSGAAALCLIVSIVVYGGMRK